MVEGNDHSDHTAGKSARRKGKGIISTRTKYQNIRLVYSIIFFLVFLLPLPTAIKGDQSAGAYSRTLAELLEADGPLYDLIYDLEECYDRHREILREEEKTAQAERERVLLEFGEKQERILLEIGKRSAGERSNREALARLGRDFQRLAEEYDLEALFPDASEERLLRCRHNLRMARLRLSTARELNEAYREVLVRRGAAQYFPEKSSEDWDLWRKEIDAYECSASEERPPLLTQIRVAAGGRRPFVLRTFCLDGNRLGPSDGQALEIIGKAEFLGRTNLLRLLKDAAAFPAREINIQYAIWEEGGEEEPEHPLLAGKADSSEQVANLVDEALGGDIEVDLRIRENFTSVDMWFENKSGEEKVINVTGAVFGTGEEDVQRLAAAGVDTEQPPPGPALKTPERALEEIRAEVAERLAEAVNRVRNGDHSRNALKDLLEALAAARSIGLDEPLEAAWDVFRDGLWEETVRSYKSYKADPSETGRADVLENLEAVRQVDPPEGKQEEFERMLEDVLQLFAPRLVETS